MNMAVTNNSGNTLNALDTYEFGTGTLAVVATGGARKYPLPYPFNLSEIEDGDTLTLPVRPRDFQTREPLNASLLPLADWANLIQKGDVAVVLTVVAGDHESDLEELAIEEFDT